MKKIMTEDFGLRVLSIVIAIVVWLIIINVTDPVKTKTIKDIPVSMVNDDVIKELGQCYEITSDNTVTVVVKGKKSVVDKLKATDFEATADMSQISITNAVPVSVKLIKSVEYEPDIVSGKNSTINVKLDNEITNSYEINLNLIGSAMNNYYISQDEIKMNVNKIKASGPQAIIDTIEKVRVDIDISDINEVTKKKYPIHAYNESGKQITSKRLELSRDYVEVTITPLIGKKISIKPSIIGDVDPNYIYKGYQTTVDSVSIAGSEEDVSAQGNIIIEFDVEGAQGTIANEYDITDYLSDNIKIVSGEKTTKITAVIEELSTRRIQFKAESLKFLNPPTDVIMNYDTEKVLVVNIKGEDDVIDNITIEDLAPHVDLANVTLGMQSIKVMFEDVDGVNIVNYPSIEIQLQDKNQVVMDNLQNLQNNNDTQQAQ
ncbi:MAG: hypothetical protein K6G26_05690 [Lachnospiraceae bacterium]|nr:hypothetical protein [Lachnospiraceae bacterium]